MSFVKDISSTPESPVRLTSDKELSGILQRMRNVALNEFSSPEMQTRKGVTDGNYTNKAENQSTLGSNPKRSSTFNKTLLSANKRIEPISLRIHNKVFDGNESSDSEENVPLRDLFSANKGSSTPTKSDKFSSKLKRDGFSSRSATKTATTTVIHSSVAHTGNNTSSKKDCPSKKSVTRRIENFNLVAKMPLANATKPMEKPKSCEKENRPVSGIHCEISKKTAETVQLSEKVVAVKGCGEFGVVSQKVFSVNNRCYHALSILGQGGSGKVYQVIESESSKIVALKEVNLDKVDKNSYMNEINLLNQLKKSDRVIKLYDHQVKGQTMLMVLEKGDSDLSTILKEAKSGCPLSPIQIKYYWSELLLAVGDVHKAGIIHLDLKPANFVQVKGKLKIIDFGIAGAIPDDKTCLVKENMIGTLNYMSPEQITGFQNNNTFQLRTKSDVWSLGTILYNLLYGVTPFHHITNIASKIQAISNPNYQITYSEIKDLHLLNVLKSCLQHDPKRRPTIEELLVHPFLTAY